MDRRIKSKTKIEFDEAIVYYESESLGLGVRFKNEIRSSIDMMLEFPELFKKPSTYTNRF